MMELQDLKLSYHDEYIHNLRETGFFLFKQLLSNELVNQLRLHVESIFTTEGESAGGENPYTEYGVMRLANLAEKGEIFSEFYAHPTVLQAVSSILGDFNLAMLNARKTLPGYGDSQRQAYHTDTDINQNNGLPDKDGFFSCTAVLFLTDSTSMNGATRIVPGSHLSYSLPQDLLTDLSVELPNEIVITGKAGDVCVFNGHCWHCGGSNESSKERLTLLAHYLRPTVYRDKFRMQALSTETKMSMSEDNLRLLGYAQNAITKEF